MSFPVTTCSTPNLSSAVSTSIFSCYERSNRNDIKIVRKHKVGSMKIFGSCQRLLECRITVKCIVRITLCINMWFTVFALSYEAIFCMWLELPFAAENLYLFLFAWTQPTWHTFVPFALGCFSSLMMKRCESFFCRLESVQDINFSSSACCYLSSLFLSFSVYCVNKRNIVICHYFWKES